MDLSAKSAFSQSLWRCALCASILSVVATSQPARAQVSGVISGVIVDSSGGAVPGASITVKNLATGGVRAATRGETGRYQVFSLPVGQYEIRAAKPGFAEEIRTGIGLVVGQEASVDITFHVG